MPLIVTPGTLNKRAELYHQLGSMLSAGIPLLKGLEMIRNNPAVRDSRRTVMQLIQHIQAGMTFTEALRCVQGWLPVFDVALLAAGEKSGRLDGSFKLLAEYYSTRARILRDTIAGMLITVATLHVFLLVFPLSYLISFAQGILTSDYARCMPFIVQKVATFGILYGGVFFLAFACQGNRGETWRAIMEGVGNLIPLLRTAMRYLALSRLSAALGALISSGVSIVSAWPLAAAASGSPYLRREVARWERPLENGTTPAELVNETRYFPEVFSNLYFTGEESGQLDDTLSRLQSYYQEEGFRWLKLFTRTMNGTLYGLIALIVAYNVISFWVGYFNAAMEGMQ